MMGLEDKTINQCQICNKVNWDNNWVSVPKEVLIALECNADYNLVRTYCPPCKDQEVYIDL